MILGITIKSMQLGKGKIASVSGSATKASGPTTLPTAKLSDGPATNSGHSSPVSVFGEDKVTLGGSETVRGGLFGGPKTAGSFGLEPLSPDKEFITPSTVEEYVDSRAHNAQLMGEIQNRPFFGGENAQVAIIDRFSHGHGAPQHGEEVEAVLRREGSLSEDDVLRIPNGSTVPREVLTLPGEMSASDRVDAFIEANQANSLDSTNAKLEKILDHGPETLTTINQSQGISVASMTEEMARTSIQLDLQGVPVKNEDGNKVLTPEGRVIFEGLGLEPEGSPENLDKFLVAAMNRSNEVHRTSPVIAEARGRHADLSQEVEDAGIDYVVAAGNDGGMSEYFQNELGVTVPDNIDDNLLTNPHNVTVAAFDNQGTATTSDDTLANFTTMNDEVDFLASGVGVPTLNGKTADGTSFASPDVSAALNEIAQANPSFSPSQRRALLHQMSPETVQDSQLSVVR